MICDRCTIEIADSDEGIDGMMGRFTEIVTVKITAYLKGLKTLGTEEISFSSRTRT